PSRDTLARHYRATLLIPYTTLFRSVVVKDTTPSPDIIGISTSGFTFNAPIVSAATSTVVASPTSVVADNSTTSTITVTLKDVNKNVMITKPNSSHASSGNSTITKLN